LWHTQSHTAKWFVSAVLRHGISGGFLEWLLAKKKPGVLNDRAKGLVAMSEMGFEYITLTASATPV